jgi:hypothetical protein
VHTLSTYPVYPINSVGLLFVYITDFRRFCIRGDHRPLMDYPRTLDGTLISTRTSLDTLSLERWPTIPYRLSTDTTVGRIHYYILKTSFVNIRAATKPHSTLAESSQIVKWTYCTMRIRGFVCRAHRQYKHGIYPIYSV